MPVRKKAELAHPAESNHESSDHNRLGLERLIFFTDAVFAIAITLLALEVRLPGDVNRLTDGELLTGLLGMWHKYLAYLISFLVIGTFWLAHHRKFGLIRRYDRRLMSLNLLILMVVAFIPFPSSVISESSGRTATIFYALTMILVGVLFSALWGYASWHNRLVDVHLSSKVRRREFLNPLLTSGVFLLSIGIAFFNADVARFAWLLIVPVSLIANRA